MARTFNKSTRLIRSLLTAAATLGIYPLWQSYKHSEKSSWLDHALFLLSGIGLFLLHFLIQFSLFIGNEDTIVNHYLFNWGVHLLLSFLPLLLLPKKDDAAMAHPSMIQTLKRVGVYQLQLLPMAILFYTAYTGFLFADMELQAGPDLAWAVLLKSLFFSIPASVLMGFLDWTIPHSGKKHGKKKHAPSSTKMGIPKTHLSGFLILCSIWAILNLSGLLARLFRLSRGFEFPGGTAVFDSKGFVETTLFGNVTLLIIWILLWLLFRNPAKLYRPLSAFLLPAAAGFAIVCFNQIGIDYSLHRLDQLVVFGKNGVDRTGKNGWERGLEQREDLLMKILGRLPKNSLQAELREELAFVRAVEQELAGNLNLHRKLNYLKSAGNVTAMSEDWKNILSGLKLADSTLRNPIQLNEKLLSLTKKGKKELPWPQDFLKLEQVLNGVGASYSYLPYQRLKQHLAVKDSLHNFGSAWFFNEGLFCVVDYLKSRDSYLVLDPYYRRENKQLKKFAGKKQRLNIAMLREIKRDVLEQKLNQGNRVVLAMYPTQSTLNQEGVKDLAHRMASAMVRSSAWEVEHQDYVTALNALNNVYLAEFGKDALKHSTLPKGDWDHVLQALQARRAWLKGGAEDSLMQAGAFQYLSRPQLESMIQNPTMAYSAKGRARASTAAKELSRMAGGDVSLYAYPAKLKSALNEWDFALQHWAKVKAKFPELNGEVDGYVLAAKMKLGQTPDSLIQKFGKRNLWLQHQYSATAHQLAAEVVGDSTSRDFRFHTRWQERLR